MCPGGPDPIPDNFFFARITDTHPNWEEIRLPMAPKNCAPTGADVRLFAYQSPAEEIVTSVDLLTITQPYLAYFNDFEQAGDTDLLTYSSSGAVIGATSSWFRSADPSTLAPGGMRSSLRMQATVGAGTGAGYQAETPEFEVQEGATYRVSAFVRNGSANSGLGPGALELRFLGAPGAAAVADFGEHGWRWQEVSAELQAPCGSQRAVARARIEPNVIDGVATSTILDLDTLRVRRLFDVPVASCP